MTDLERFHERFTGLHFQETLLSSCHDGVHLKKGKRRGVKRKKDKVGEEKGGKNNVEEEKGRKNKVEE